MRRYRVLKRLAAALACVLVINMILSAFPPYPLAASARAAKQGSPVPEESMDAQWPDGRKRSMATPSGTSWEEGKESVSSGAQPATPSEASTQREEETQALFQDDMPTAPAGATPSNASRQIIAVVTPTLVVLEAGEADDGNWKEALPQKTTAHTESVDGLWCDLEWSVPYADWEQPGMYSARVKIIPPDGYTIEERDRFYDAVISIHPPGTSQVMEVYFPMYRGMMKGHTWTFAMKAGQDMTPLVEALEEVKTYRGILDDYPSDSILFSAEWDFSAVNPNRPGIYPIYRTLTLIEDSLPEGVNPEDVYLPEYWKKLPVLFSVEKPGGPQLYGVLESPFLFFGSYAKLSEEDLESLEVWYSIDGGEWTPQRGEGLMNTEEKNFFIHKDAMAEGSSYSFYLKLGTFTSQILTVKKDETSPVWFTSMMDGSRDGTIEVEFPSVSQPPPTEPSGEEPTKQPPTEPSGEEPTKQPPTEPSGEEPTKQPPPEPSGEEPTKQPPPEPSGEEPTKQPPPEPSGEEPTRQPPEPSGEEPTKQPTEPSGDTPSINSSRPASGGSDYGNSGDNGGPGPGGGHTVKSADGSPSPALPGPVTGDFPSSVLPYPYPGSPSPIPPIEHAETRQPDRSLTVPELSRTDRQGNGESAGSLPGAGEEAAQETAGDSGASAASDSSSGSLSAPEEVVTRWTTQISGIRVRKLIELYPDWILFQKEDVSVLLSSQWLNDQQMRDSDVLTVSVSPGEDRTVTVLINQKAPQTPPVCRITIGERERGRSAGAAAAVILSLTAAGAMAALFWRRRWKG